MEKDKRFGLLVVPSRHICQPPSLFWHLFVKMGPRIKRNDLWRCQDCCRVWRVADVIRNPIWITVSINDWTKAGGIE
jgi:hypothetical protein